MAITKEYLIGLGLTEEQANEVFKERGKEITEATEKYGVLEASVTSKDNTIVELNKKLQGAKTQEDLDNLKNEYEKQLSEEKKNSRLILLNSVIKDNGGLDEISIKAHLDLEAIDNAVDPRAEMERQVLANKEKFNYLYGENKLIDNNNLGGGDPEPEPQPKKTIQIIRGGQVLPKDAITVDDIMAIENDEDRQRAIQENYQLFNYGGNNEQ